MTNLSGNPGNLHSNVVIYPPNSTTPGAAWQSPIANAALLGLALQSPDYAPGGDAYVAYGNTSATSGGGVPLVPSGHRNVFRHRHHDLGNNSVASESTSSVAAFATYRLTD